MKTVSCSLSWWKQEFVYGLCKQTRVEKKKKKGIVSNSVISSSWWKQPARLTVDKLLGSQEWRCTQKPCSPEEICETLTASHILDAKRKPNGITGRETVKIYFCLKHFTQNILVIWEKSSDLISVIFPLLSNWQHWALSRQQRQDIGCFCGLSLKYRGKTVSDCDYETRHVVWS